MPQTTLRPLFAGLVLLALTLSPHAAAERVAVVELFTSEGCSSCPPAERLLNELHAVTVNAEGLPLIALAYHVDYWDRLGWADPYADPRFSARQRSYARRLEDGRVYTPNMVVNGVASFVGSSPSDAKRAIETALAAVAPVGVTLNAQPDDASTLAVAWALEGPLPAGARLHIAVTEDGLVSQVGRGENRGRTLAHDAVVRRWQSQEAQSTGRTELALPDDLQTGRSAVVVLVQDGDTGAVLGASRIPLGPGTEPHDAAASAQNARGA